MKRLTVPFRRRHLMSVTAGCCAAILGASSAHAADVFKADNLDNLNLTTSWDGGVAPGTSDVAVWDNRVATAVPQNVLLGADLSWAGIRVLDPAGAVSIATGNSLTLGAAGIDTSGGSQILTLSCPVVSGAEQTWNLVSGVTLSGGLSGSSSITLGSGILTINGGTMTLSNLIVHSGATVSINVGGLGIVALNGGTFSVNGAINEGIHVMDGGGTEQNTGGNRTWSGNLTGSGPLTVIASSTHTWSGNNTAYTGTLTLQGSGALRLNNVNAVSAGTAYVFNGGTMNPNVNGSFQLGSLAGSGNVNPGTGRNFTIGALGTDTTFSGVIGGAGGIIKVGAGTLVLDGANTFSGATVVSNGFVQIGNGGETGKLGSGSVSNDTALIFNRSGVLLAPNAIHGSGIVSNAGPGYVALTGANTYSGPTYITAGTLAFGSASLATGGITVADGASSGAVVTSGAATLTQGDISFGSGSAYEFDLGTFGNHPGTVVSNVGTITMNSPVTVNIAGTNLSVGTINLMRYANRAGAGSFVLGTLPLNVTANLTDDQVNKVLRLNITAVQTGVDMTFRYLGDAAGVWDIDNPANQIWRVIGTGQNTNYTEGAAVRFDDTATGTTNIDVSTIVNPFAITVANTNKTFAFGGSGSISGAASLTKRGPGTLLITNANSYSGPTVIEAGRIVIAGESGSLSGTAITNNAALIIDRTEATNSLPSTMSFANQIAGSGGVTFLGVDSTNSIVELQIGVPEGNPYSGGTTISNTFVRLNANPVSDATRSAAKTTGLGSGQITFLGDSVLELEDFGVGNNSAQAGGFSAPLNIPAGQVGTFRIGGRMTVSSSLTGGGTLNLAVSYVRAVISGDLSAFTGQVNVSPSPNATGNQFQIANAAGLPNAKVNLMAGVTMGGNGPMANNSVVPIGELSGEAGSFINTVGEAARTANFTVGGLNTSTTFAGNIGGPHSLTKVGTGTLTLSGLNDFTGTTTISNGVLALIGETGVSNNPAIRLSSPGVLDVSARTDATLWLGTDVVAQTLGGSGAIQGSLVVGGQGTIAPTGVLNVTGSVALGGSTAVELNRASSPNSGRIVSPAITASGSLTVTNVGMALQAGDTFQLFGGAVTGFSSVTLPTTDANQVSYTWNNKLAVDGTIVVLTATGAVNSNPTNMLFSAGGGSLTLEWPDSHVGWTLQTNSVGLAATNQWFPFPGSTQTNRLILAIDPTKTNIFYRLVYP